MFLQASLSLSYWLLILPALQSVLMDTSRTQLTTIAKLVMRNVLSVQAVLLSVKSALHLAIVKLSCLLQTLLAWLSVLMDISMTQLLINVCYVE